MIASARQFAIVILSQFHSKFATEMLYHFDSNSRSESMSPKQMESQMS